jgi:DNA-directed RNA polymerase specialized sigma24 family protein
MGGKRWDHVEDSTLRVWCDKESCKQLAERVGRSVGSVKARLQTLGIKKKNIYQNKTWTKEMETFLKSRAGQQSPKSIAKSLGVSRKVLRLKASRLGVSLRVYKNRLWTESEIDILTRQVQKAIYLQDYPHLSWDNISKVVGRSPQSCRKKASEFGLTLELKKEWKTTELKYIHSSRLIGMSYKEIATHLNRTESSVRKRYARYKKESNLS